MKMYEQGKGQDIADALTGMLEQETGQKIFTMRILETEEREKSDVLETLVVFEDKSILNAFISIQTVEGKMAARMQGNWI